MLKVLSLLSYDHHWNRNALVRCYCGNTWEVRLKAIKSGNTISCGCSRREQAVTFNPLYKTWIAMKQRCYNKHFSQFKDYGGRGVRVCERWQESFSNFYADMGNRPIGKTLDRVDNNGNYTPENCRWATRREQQLNRRICGKD